MTTIPHVFTNFDYSAELWITHNFTNTQIVELADQSEWTDPETGRLQFDRLGFAQAVERKVLAARNAAQSTQPESAQVSTEQAGDAWISVEDRLPKPYEEVIVWPHPTDYCMTAEFYGRSASGRPVWKYGEYENGWGHSNVEITAPVTHWQPKPAAPSPNNSPVGGKGEQ